MTILYTSSTGTRITLAFSSTYCRMDLTINWIAWRHLHHSFLLMIGESFKGLEQQRFGIGEPFVTQLDTQSYIHNFHVLFSANVFFRKKLYHKIICKYIDFNFVMVYQISWKQCFTGKTTRVGPLKCICVIYRCATTDDRPQIL